MTRKASISRKIGETEISVSLEIEGTGLSDIRTGIGFFDHMLEQFSRHSLMHVQARSDLHIYNHHTVEDCGILLDRALFEALGERRGITRYASLDLAMDECFTRAAIDVSRRPFLVWQVAFSAVKTSVFDTELVREFFQAFAQNADITLHIINHYGANSHTILPRHASRWQRACCAQRLQLIPVRRAPYRPTKESLKG